jgi:hypothetical protein
MEIEKLSLGSEFQGTKARVCTIDGIRYISVFDLITAVTGGSADGVTTTWKRIKEDDFEVGAKCSDYQFPGKAQRKTPITDVETAVEIITLLPGKRAKQYRKAGVKALLNVMNPSQDFVNEMTERFELQARNQNFLCATADKVVSLASRPYTDTHLYVRIRLPAEYLKSVQNRKALTLSILKFGITYNLNERHKQYNRDEADNGYMIFSFAVNSRSEAEIIENILKVDFGHITVDGSREYVDTGKLAEILKVEYDATSYESYVILAEHLFRYMVKIITLLWGDRYEAKGYVYGLSEMIPKFVQQKLSKSCEIVDEPLEVELGFVRKVFDLSSAESESAKDKEQCLKLLKVEKNEHLATQKRLITLQRKMEELQGKLSNNSVSSANSADQDTDETLDCRTRGKVISRDIITGEEVTYSSAEKAANAAGYTPAALRRSFIDKPRQLRGKHWRSAGMPHWIPMDGLCFNPEYIEKKSDRYIKAVNENDSDDVRVYESVVAAAIFSNIEPRTLNSFVNHNLPYKGYFWTDIPIQEWGTWSRDDNGQPVNITSKVIPRTAELADTGKDGRCNGRIISRDLQTGEETVHDSVSRAAACEDMSSHALRDNFLDKARHVRGKHYRSWDAKKYWQPPAYFRYNPSSFEKKTGGYVISEDKDGNKSLYESAKVACDLENLTQGSLKSYIGHPEKELQGKTWRKALDPEVETWVTL